MGFSEAKTFQLLPVMVYQATDTNSQAVQVVSGLLHLLTTHPAIPPSNVLINPSQTPHQRLSMSIHSLQVWITPWPSQRGAPSSRGAAASKAPSAESAGE